MGVKKWGWNLQKVFYQSIYLFNWSCYDGVQGRKNIYQKTSENIYKRLSLSVFKEVLLTEIRPQFVKIKTMRLLKRQQHATA